MSLYDNIHESANYIQNIIGNTAKTAIVLGTGLGEYIHSFDSTIEIDYENIPHFPTSTVLSHRGKMVFGFKGNTPIILMAGRFHYYEGYSAAEVTFPIRVLKSLGIENIILTNAAGGINPHFSKGDIVLVHDHINLMPDHPLRGPHDERLGPRFPDMSQAYDEKTMGIFENIATENNISLKNGVYLALQGPSLETPAEYKMAHILGADLVGMSTIPEVIVANHIGMKVTVFSIVSNVCYPLTKISFTTLEEIIEVVNHSASTLQLLFDKYFESVE